MFTPRNSSSMFIYLFHVTSIIIKILNILFDYLAKRHIHDIIKTINVLLSKIKNSTVFGKLRLFIIQVIEGQMLNIEVQKRRLSFACKAKLLNKSKLKEIVHDVYIKTKSIILFNKYDPFFSVIKS